jgi:hypothetical protein
MAHGFFKSAQLPPAGGGRGNDAKKRRQPFQVAGVGESSIMQLHDRLATSAAFPGLFLRLFGPIGVAFVRLVCALIPDFLGCLFLLFHGAAGAALFRPSAARGCGFFHLSATGARLGPSAAAGVGPGHGDAPHAQQPGDAQAGKKFFQFFPVHPAPPDA